MTLKVNTADTVHCSETKCSVKCVQIYRALLHFQEEVLSLMIGALRTRLIACRGVQFWLDWEISTPSRDAVACFPFVSLSITCCLIRRHQLGNITQRPTTAKNSTGNYLFPPLVKRVRTQGLARRLLTNASKRTDTPKYRGHDKKKTLLLSSNHTNSLLSTARASSRTQLRSFAHSHQSTPHRTAPSHGMILQFFFFFQKSLTEKKNNACYSYCRSANDFTEPHSAKRKFSVPFFLRRTALFPRPNNSNSEGETWIFLTLFFHNDFDSGFFLFRIEATLLEHRF